MRSLHSRTGRIRIVATPVLALCGALICTALGAHQLWAGLSYRGQVLPKTSSKSTADSTTTVSFPVDAPSHNAVASGRNFPLRTKSIQDIRVGERVMAHN